jgi:hypothetical protein
MTGFPSPFGGSDDGSGLFDEYDEFVEEHIPTPGWFLEDQDVLQRDDHIAFHETTKEFFEDRGVYDMTFGYNLARLNLDTRHPDAGYRYAIEPDDSSILRAEFTPTTPFCPQSDTLTKGSFRAWNDLSDRHEYDLVRVRVKEMHHQSEEINRTLEELEEHFRETGSVAHFTSGANEGSSSGAQPGKSKSNTYDSGPESPF